MVFIEKSWRLLLKDEFEKQYFKDLVSFLKKEYKKHTVFPKYSSIFAAFNLCSFNNLKVVILGQDPYPGEKQANGLCFSVDRGIAIPKSLQNIFKEVKEEFGHVKNFDGDLSRWATQGVLLLNTTLTVRAHQPGSHFNHGWEIFTDNVLRIINKNKKRIVYLLWGNKAIQKSKLLDKNNNLILTSAHPSPLSAYRGFLGNCHFLKTNEYLKRNKIDVIDWS